MVSGVTKIKQNSYSIYKSMKKKTNDRLSSTIMGYLLGINKVVKGKYTLVLIKRATSDDIEISYISEGEDTVKLLITDIYDKSETYIINEIVGFCSECYWISEYTGSEKNVRDLSIIVGVSERETRSMIDNILKKSAFYFKDIGYDDEKK